MSKNYVEFRTEGGKHRIMEDDREFDAEILQVIQRTLSERFGEDVTKVVVYNFQKFSRASKEEIARNPKQFDSFLESLFGTGSGMIRKMIAREIAKHFQLTGSAAEVFDLNKIIKEARKARQLG